MNTELLALIGTVIAASVVGSLHCAGMCGAFVAMAVGLDRSGSRTKLHAAYNGGRLVTYATIGAAAGVLGAAFDIGGQALGLQRAAIGLAAATMITIGAIGLARSFGVRLPKARGPKVLEATFVRLHGIASRMTPTKRAAAIGLMTGLLPCGWLYAFALLAAGTAHPVAGAIVMAAFWLGTLPILITLGAGVRTLAGAIGRHAPRDVDRHRRAGRDRGHRPRRPNVCRDEHEPRTDGRCAKRRRAPPLLHGRCG
ncbi:MAG: sulfite exporter TauE/SafE family protein [Planctomycetota bacterium]